MSKLVLGKGINNVPGSSKTPEYRIWVHILERVYCPKYQARQPSYIGVTLCHEWHDFKNFQEWFKQSNYEPGWQLDKDLLNPSAREYSPQNCIFIPVDINNCFRTTGNSTGFPGVAVNGKGFCSILTDCGKVNYLGQTETAFEAHKLWQNAKIQVLKRLLVKYKKYADIMYALITSIRRIQLDIARNRITYMN